MKHHRGFSLLETLLYIGIFAIVGGALFGILTNVVRISTKEVSGDEVSSQLNFAMSTINRLVRESSNIETATTTATTTLKLRMSDPATDPTCITLSGGKLKLAQGPDAFQKQNCTATMTDITTDRVVVDSALFKKLEFPGGHDQVTVDLQFSNLATGASKISRALRSGISRASAATFDSDLLPNADAQYEVGFAAPSTKRWKNISISNLLNLGVASSDPAGIDGSVYYNSTSKTFRGRSNGSWNDLNSSLWLATSTNMYSNVTGNVGIGTATPSFPLSFGASLGSKMGLYDMGSGAGYGMGIQPSLLQIFAHGATDRVGIGYGNSAAFTETLSVKGSNVGIGVIAPKYTLDVNGVASFGGGSGNLDPTGAISLAPLQNTGKSLIGWNRTAGGGEMDFINNKGGGTAGGFKFYDYSNAGTLTEVLGIPATGGIRFPDGTTQTTAGGMNWANPTTYSISWLGTKTINTPATYKVCMLNYFANGGGVNSCEVTRNADSTWYIAGVGAFHCSMMCFN